MKEESKNNTEDKEREGHRLNEEKEGKDKQTNNKERKGTKEKQDG